MAWGHPIAAIVEDAASQQGFGCDPHRFVIGDLLVQLGLNRIKQALVDDGGLLALQDLTFEVHLSDIEAVAKELADLLYVVYGTAVSCGIDMAPVFREVHRSNMSKVGGHKRADGKWMKPPNYSPARLQPILAAQGT